MTVQAHIESVATKRENIKARIAQEMAHPSPDFGLITELKKKNLVLKQEMMQLLKQLKTAAAS